MAEEKPIVERLIITIECNAPAGLFEGDFDNLSPEHQALFRSSSRVRCESGTLGTWCRECRFGEVSEELEIEWEVANENPNL